MMLYNVVHNIKYLPIETAVTPLVIAYISKHNHQVIF